MPDPLPLEEALTDPQIYVLVDRYTREMARYEEVAWLVERRLSRALRGNAIRALLSSRAKHPDDLRVKLGRKRSDHRYEFTGIEGGLDRVVTDLSGCRLMVYRWSDVEQAERVVRSAFELAPLPGSLERHDKKDSGYRATHVLVKIGDDEERLSLRGAICEVQITSLARHVFNELEHDIRYKDQGLAPTLREEEVLDDVASGTRMLDRAVERVLVERAKSVRRRTVPLRDAEDLRFVLEQDAGHRLHGEFVRLFRLLNAVNQPLTASALTTHGSVEQLLERGGQQAEHLRIEDADDVVRLALGVFEHHADEFEELVRSHDGPATMLTDAVLRAANERKGRP